MLTFNNQYYVLGEQIIKKDGSLKYKLPKKLARLIYHQGIENYNNSFNEFLLKENIIGYYSKYYNPIITKSSNYNKMRLFIQLTGNCNLKCKHCFVGGSSNEKNYFTLNRVKKIVDEATELGIYQIDFTGGEIFTVNYFTELIKYLDSIPVITTLFTNLAFLSNEQLNAIIESSSIVSIITSLDYFNKNDHDNFRGVKGAFDSTMSNIQVLRSNGVKVTVNSMVMNNNHDDILSLIKYLSTIGASIHLDTVIMKGNAKLNRELFYDINTYKNISFIADIIKNMYKCSQEDILKYIRNDKCGIGETLLYLDKDGNFQLCPGLTKDSDKRFFLGNSIQDARDKLLSFNLGCNNIECVYHSECSYGCRERALIDSGSILAPDEDLCKLIHLLY